MDINDLRPYLHFAASSLLAGLAIVTYLVRGQTIVIGKALIASAAFALASLWFGLLSATVKDHELFNRADLVPLLFVAELGFVFLGWAWFVFALTQTFTIERRVEAEW